MRTLRRTFGAMKAWEKIVLVAFCILFVLSTAVLCKRFYRENTESIPVRGGTYIEGSVGSIKVLNPWFTVTNDVNRDITSLVFAGLQRYNPFSGKVEDDLATLEITGNHQIYTLTLRNNIFWHDTTDENPHPVTADDVIFTYQMIEQQGFPNPILQKNFRGVDIEKIDDRTVQFRLEKPYYFFRSNLTLGIVPKNQLERLKPDQLLDAYDFNLHPIGCGPFAFKSVVETPLSTEVTLEIFEKYYGAKPFLERVVLRAFPDYPSLLSDLRNLDGVRHVPRSTDGKAVIPKRYVTFPYTLPQYVALFLNLDHEALQDKNLRLALQLATNKQSIVDSINEASIVDTPLLEYTQEDWKYNFEPEAAQGALYDSDWNLPEKVRLQSLLEDRERNSVGNLALVQSIVLLETGAQLTVTGSYAPKLKTPLFLNDIPVVHIAGSTETGSWVANLHSDGSSGSLLIGRNALRLTETGGNVIDTFVLTRTADKDRFQKLKEEQKIVDLFLERSATGVSIATLFMDEGILRLKRPEDLHGIRVDQHGNPLRLTLLTSPLPPTYPKVAEEVAKEWRNIGVDVVVIIPKDKKEFEDKVIRRDYDVLLFGQPLLDNLDSYPYWHSSQKQTFEVSETSEQIGQRLDANNLSQFANFKADALLEQIRETHNEDVRKQTLESLREVFREEVPAIVLYSPTYVFAVSDKILGVDLGKPSLHSDRFLSMHRWFRKQGRTFKAGKSWWSFVPWLFSISDEEKSSTSTPVAPQSFSSISGD
ncbi:MAG TPA: ABC transporter substrate-binding protein [Candidatus Peribacterales bacterium]|nr:ABC transporter substrate-binding protein [Candidatus Peribacterales bacterium]